MHSNYGRKIEKNEIAAKWISVSVKLHLINGIAVRFMISRILILLIRCVVRETIE